MTKRAKIIIGVFTAIVVVTLGSLYALSRTNLLGYGTGTLAPLSPIVRSGNLMYPRDTDADFTLFSNASDSSPFHISIEGDDITLYGSGSFTGFNLSDCDGSTQKLSWDVTTGQFGCGTDTSGSTSSNSLDFDEFVDSMTLDADLTVSSATYGIDWTGTAFTGVTGNISMFTNDSGYLTGNETITLSGAVTGSGETSIITSLASESFYDTAYGWGDHSTQGYQTTTNSNIPFVTIGNTASADFERAITGTANQITITDGGANSTVTLSIPADLQITNASVSGVFEVGIDAFRVLADGTINAGTWNGNSIGDAYLDDGLTASNYVRKNTWTDHDNYPTGCTNQFVTAIGDTLTCETVDIGNDSDLSVSALGLTLTGSDIDWTAGYEGVLTASASNWDNFYQSPSTVITAGTDLSWATNTLNLDSTLTQNYTFDAVGTAFIVDNNASVSGNFEVTGDILNFGQVGTLADPSSRSLNTWLSNITSTGRISGGEITDNGDRTVAVAAGTGWIKATDDDLAPILRFEWTASSSVDLADDDTTWVGIDYNSGSPKVTKNTTDVWDFDTNFPLGSVVLHAAPSLSMHISSNPMWTADANTNIIERFYQTNYIERANKAGGLILGESADNNRNVTVTAGTMWSRLNEFEFSALDTAVAGDFELYWREGGSWVEADRTEWNNESYDNGGNLASISANRYSNQYFYADLDGDLLSVLGQAQFTTIAGAEAEGAPSTVPDSVAEHSLIIGRIIRQDGQTIATSVESAFTTTFSGAIVTDHGNLSGLGDDDHTQYILVDGTRAFTGGVDFGGFDISNIGNVSAVTASISDGFEASGYASASAIYGAGLVDCDTAGTSKLLWSAETGTFSCGTDQNTGGSGGTAIGVSFDDEASFDNVTSISFNPNVFEGSISSELLKLTMDWVNGAASRSTANTWTAHNIFSTTASVTGNFEVSGTASVSALTGATISGFDLSDCDNATTSKLLWSDTGVFVCGTDTDTDTDTTNSNIPFVTIGNTASTAFERALTGTANEITITDNGANSTVVLSLHADIARDSELHDAVTLAGTPNYITLSGQELTLTKLDMSDDTNLTVGAAGLALTANDIDYVAGFEGFLTASGSDWDAFEKTPSTVITAGDNLSWDGNTLNAVAGSGGGTDFIGVNVTGGTFSHITSLSFDASDFDIANVGSNSFINLDYVNGAASRSANNTWTGTNEFDAAVTVDNTLTVGDAGDNYDVLFNSDVSGNGLQWDANAATDGRLLLDYSEANTRAWNAAMPGIIFVTPTDGAGTFSPGLFLNLENNDGFGNRLDMGWGGANGGNFELYSKVHDARAGEFRVVYGGGDFGHIQFTHYNGTQWYVNSGVNQDGRFMVGFKDFYFPAKDSSTLEELLYPFTVFNEGTNKVFHVETDGDVVATGSMTSAAIFGSGLTDCDNATTSKLLWNIDDGTFSCGTDQTGAGAGADTDIPFVTIGNTASIAYERALTGTANEITITDNGANSTVVISAHADMARDTELSATASRSNWDGFYQAPSSVITAGASLSWDGNTLNFDGNHAAVTITGQDFITAAGQALTIGEIEPDDLAASDFGDFSCDGDTCTLDDTYLGALSGSNNQVLTDDGAGNIVSEANFTFDGSLLDITGNASVSGNFEVTGNIYARNEYIYGDTNTPSLRLSNSNGTYLYYGTTGLAAGGANSKLVVGGSDILDATALGVDITGNASVSGNFEVTGTIKGDVTGALTGNASTATALAADPDDCAAGSYPLGIDQNGDVVSCTDATTEIDSAITTHAGDNDAHHALVTVAGTPNYVTISGQELTLAKLDISDDTNAVGGRSITLTSNTFDADAELYTDTKCVWFENPTAADDFKSIWRNDIGKAVTITEMWCESDQTVNLDLQVDDGSPADVNGSDLACDSSEVADTSMGGDAEVADGEELDLIIESVSGTPTWVSVCWTFTKND